MGFLKISIKIVTEERTFNFLIYKEISIELYEDIYIDCK